MRQQIKHTLAMTFRGLFSQYKKNRVLAAWETTSLALANRRGTSPIVAPGGPDVSLTSWGRRIETVYSTIESIGRGTVKPSRVELWLGEKEAARALPVPLRRLVDRGLTVSYVQDEGPHTKYYPYVASREDFERPMVTADDDIFYPVDWLERLVQAHAARPELIHAYRAKCVRLEGGTLTPSKRWGMCGSTQPHACHLATGVSGVIYPPSFLRHLKQAGTEFRSCSPRDDDLWLHVQALRSGHRVAQLGPNPQHFVGRLWTQGEALYRFNVRRGGTDAVLPKAYGEREIAVLREADLQRCAQCRVCGTAPPRAS